VSRLRVAPPSRFAEHLAEIPVCHVASVGLLEIHLELTPQSLVAERLKIVACDQNVNALSTVILNFNRLARSRLKGQTLFIGELWSHRLRIPRGKSSDHSHVRHRLAR
jgi:hypothetical protein